MAQDVLRDINACTRSAVLGSPAVLTHRAIPMGNVIVWAELQVVLSANCQHDEKEGELMGVEKCGAARRVLEVTGLDLDVSRVDLINNLI
jgi:hypothetical protein